ncbi:hypothetical protein [Nitrososphaera sp.]|uniref:hypothetical protein n=1 Tax=Nitrososphaera sp. TaxID=1971748 RepID=UPI00307D012B
MHTKKAGSFAVLAAVIALSAFTMATGSAAKAFADQEHIDFATNIEFIRGHLDKAVENKEAGNNVLATAHAGHPAEEVYSLVKEEIQEHDADLESRIEGALNGLFSDIATLSLEDVQGRVDGINADLDSAMEAVVPSSESGEPAFWAQVVNGLLETAEHEYEEGVADGAVKEEIEYQDATAFIGRAKAVFENIRADTPENEAEEVDEFFQQLDALTASAASAGEVETVIDGIKHELEEAFGLESAEASELGGWEYIEQINRLLDQSVSEYREGNFDEARALAVEAYLDNYEYIETDIAEDDKELMEKIEVDMRTDLVKMIDDRAPADDIQAHVDQIKADLQTAKAVVTPEFPVAALAASLGVAGTIAYGRLRGFGRRA